MATPTYGASRGPAKYYLHIQNLPKRYLWQDLKDLIRRQATHGLRADMAVLPNGQHMGVGGARVQGKEEADRLYHYLTTNYIEKRALTVHLWDITGDIAVLVRCNSGRDPRSYAPSAQISALAVRPDWQYFMPTSPVPVQSRSYPMVAPNGYSAPQMATTMAPTMPVMAPPAMQQPTPNQLAMAMTNMSLDPMNPMDQARFTQYMQSRQAQMAPPAVQYPTYARNAIGLPTNTSKGLVQTQARGIFVSGLDYKAKTGDIEEYFADAGKIIRVDLQKDPATGKSKGNATIEYASAESVQTAIEMFHDRKFMSMRVKVRPDRNPTAVSAPPGSTSKQQRKIAGAPTIVNGSVQATAGAAQVCPS